MVSVVFTFFMTFVLFMVLCFSDGFVFCFKWILCFFSWFYGFHFLISIVFSYGFYGLHDSIGNRRY